MSEVHHKCQHVKNLPRELEDGIRQAGSECYSYWERYWQECIKRLTLWEKGGRWEQKDYDKSIGHCWKTLEIGMNAAKLDLSFILFFCTKVMRDLCWLYSGGMTFLPTLDSQLTTSSSSSAAAAAAQFTSKVRYRAQGKDPTKRYRGSGLTRNQASGIYSLRPWLAAQGILPPDSKGYRESLKRPSPKHWHQGRPHPTHWKQGPRSDL